MVGYLWLRKLFIVVVVVLKFPVMQCVRVVKVILFKKVVNCKDTWSSSLASIFVGSLCLPIVLKPLVSI